MQLRQEAVASNCQSIKFDSHVLLGKDCNCHAEHRLGSSHCERFSPLAVDGGPSLEFAVSTDPSQWNCAVQLQGSHVVPALGIHPWFLLDYNPAWLERLEGLIVSNPRCHIGEIGLDFAFRVTRVSDSQQSHCTKTWESGCRCNSCYRKLMVIVFRKQLEMAVAYERICSIHSVRAHKQVIDELCRLVQTQGGKPLPLRINLHSWNASAEQTSYLFRQIPQELEACIYFGVSAHVNFRPLFRYDIDTKSEPKENLWRPVKPFDFTQWYCGSDVDPTPWRHCSPKAWTKFAQLLKLYPRDRLLLETDLPSSIDDCYLRRWELVRLAAHVIGDALRESPDLILKDCATNLADFVGLNSGS